MKKLDWLYIWCTISLILLFVLGFDVVVSNFTDTTRLFLLVGLLVALILLGLTEAFYQYRSDKAIYKAYNDKNLHNKSSL